MTNQANELCVGIDLGTTNICNCVYQYAPKRRSRQPGLLGPDEATMCIMWPVPGSRFPPFWNRRCPALCTIRWKAAISQ